LRDAVIQQHPSKKDLTTKYKGRLLRYRRKIIKTFNDLLIDIKSMLEKLSELNDPEMIRLREIIVAEIGELSDGAEAIMDLLDDPSSDVFTKTLEQISAQMEKRHRSISDVIDNQLGNHINHDILGKMRISQMLFRIRKRARIVRYLMNIDY
jgi:capsid portal protein